ncbi:MAG: hypothetical protein C4334_12200 [Pyrinomonas sp.]
MILAELWLQSLRILAYEIGRAIMKISYLRSGVCDLFPSAFCRAIVFYDAAFRLSPNVGGKYAIDDFRIATSARSG